VTAPKVEASCYYFRSRMEANQQPKFVLVPSPLVIENNGACVRIYYLVEAAMDQFSEIRQPALESANEPTSKAPTMIPLGEKSARTSKTLEIKKRKRKARPASKGERLVFARGRLKPGGSGPPGEKKRKSNE
jgi:hypothetical protein